MTNAPERDAARVTKLDTLLILLQTGTGASLEEMTDFTSWQPHTVRAAMTGLRKRAMRLRGTLRVILRSGRLRRLSWLRQLGYEARGKAHSFGQAVSPSCRRASCRALNYEPV
jgi:Protein of unknown function (DUF3489)